MYQHSKVCKRFLHWSMDYRRPDKNYQYKKAIIKYDELINKMRPSRLKPKSN